MKPTIFHSFSTYPILLLPDDANAILGTKHGPLPVPEEPVMPAAPEIKKFSSPQPTSPSSFTAIVGSILLFLCMPCFTVNDGEAAGWGIGLLLSGILLIIIYFNMHSSYVSDIKEYSNNLLLHQKKHQNDINVFNERKEILMNEYRTHLYWFNSYNNEYNGIKPTFILQRYKVFLTFNNTSKPKIHPEYQTVKKGKSESYFLKYLRNTFRDEISDNQTFINSIEDNSLLLPDYVFYNKEFNICIDIEIDEPYSMDSKSPIHYSKSDDNRNELFLSNNWIVVRFTEKQVVTQPSECCDFLAYLINELSLDLLKYPVNGSYKEIIRTPIWTQDDCISMANNNYRAHYLNKLK